MVFFFFAKRFSCARQGGSDNVTVGFDVNCAMVVAFNEMGQGPAAMKKFSALLNIPSMHHRTYQRLAKPVGTAHVDVGETVLQASAEAVRDVYHHLDDNGSRDDDDDDSDDDDDNGPGAKPIDVSVSFNRTWHKRAFTSNCGVGVVIEVQTGLVLDCEVLSQFCQTCALNDSRDRTDGERALWRQQHQPHCHKNFDGSSKATDKEAALRLWRRSLPKHNMRYTSMLSDGDSIAHKAVNDEKVYGDTIVEKLQCVNHCDKRTGTALRKRAKDEKLGGKRHGALTAKGL